MSASRIRPALAFGATLALVTGLAGCGGDEEAPAAPKGAEEVTEAAATDEPTDEATEEETTEPENSEGGDRPDWASEVTTPGDKISTIDVGDVTVDVYQVGTAPSPKDGMWVDPDTDKPLIAEGDDIVYVNYVITNNGDPLQLGSLLVDVSPRYDDWEWMQGMGSITDSELMEEMDVNNGGIEPGKNNDPAVYVLGTGETFSYGTNFKYQSDSPITFTASYIPVDEEAELQHDDKVEAEGTGTIK